MSAILVTLGNLSPDGAEALQQYASAVLPLLLREGGQKLLRGGPVETLVGSNPPDLVFAMRFESAHLIRRILTSEEYLAQIPHRNKAFQSITTFVLAEFD